MTDPYETMHDPSDQPRTQVLAGWFLFGPAAVMATINYFLHKHLESYAPQNLFSSVAVLYAIVGLFLLYYAESNPENVRAAGEPLKKPRNFSAYTKIQACVAICYFAIVGFIWLSFLTGFVTGGNFLFDDERAWQKLFGWLGRALVFAPLAWTFWYFENKFRCNQEARAKAANETIYGKDYYVDAESFEDDESIESEV